ncbi:redox-regulated ATPase YchF [Spirochaeta africana]|uniref:Ribosome-binding ATPase YchF n=1 Tax=Spirochaeta africana (strain ATCC 700263 / DSM 8902 / Z-7692) TaxID=889378 RepID=H9UG17_SPIAZ|nr:redox-regulated ATPase YchF [Spirochaeta africana]AFG36460.1 GTP-binding protein YchF [Spirochaeta africana DSM 8902]
MALNCGIVGLPNVGKSTLFSALTSAPAEAANYPFCTIDPNKGIVDVPDPRLAKITEFIQPKKVIPAICEFLDIAGLVEGASKGEGLGNQFLAHIRETGIIAHVVRCFDDPDVVHVAGSVDPVRDIETINVELALADLETVEKRLTRTERETRSNDRDAAKKAQGMLPLLQRLKDGLSQGTPARTLGFTDDELELMRDLHLITLKRTLYVCNVDEGGLEGDNPLVAQVEKVAAGEDAEVIRICGQLEAEIAALETPEERAEFLAEAGLEQSGLDRLIHAAYHLMGLHTYFTAGEKEVRAWTIPQGAAAPQAAGVIHSDFERGFIAAETFHYDDLLALGSKQKVREAGKLRIEGKNYIVKDGDIIEFRFNV